MQNFFAILRPHFNPRPSSSLSKLKIPSATNYDFVNITKNDNLQWKTIEDPEEIERLIILKNKHHLR